MDATIKSILKHNEERVSILKNQMRLHSGLISHNLIIEVGASFVSSNDEHKAILVKNNSNELPAQWTEAGFNEIKEKCSWRNMLGNEMEITAISYKDWYQRELEEAQRQIEMFTV